MIEGASLDGLAEALRRHRVVLVRGLALGERQHIRLAASLGRLVGARRGLAQVRVEDDAATTARARADNERWHADLSWCQAGPALSLLYAVATEPGAVGTELLDTADAYAGLDGATRQEIEGWTALHDIEHSREGRAPEEPRIAPAPPGGAERARRLLRRVHPAAVPPVAGAVGGATHAVVHHGAAAGDAYVLLGDHAWTLVGRGEADGRAAVADLGRRLVDAGRIERHDWTTGDLLVVDSRSVLHRRAPGGRTGVARVLRRCCAWPAKG